MTKKAHSTAPHQKGDTSHVPHPPSEDHPDKDSKPIPYTGWDDPVPSKDGGDGEKDFENKPPYSWSSDKFEPKYLQECWCGKLQFEFASEPLDAKHCHCLQCQRLHGAPFQWAVIFPKTSVRMIKNEGNSLDFFSTEARTSAHHVPVKVSCRNCRSPLFDEGRNMVLAYPSSFHFDKRYHEETGEWIEDADLKGKKDGPGRIPNSFMPSAHIFYGQRVMEIPDGVPKWEGHKGRSKLIEEVSSEGGMLPKYKLHNKEREEGDEDGRQAGNDAKRQKMSEDEEEEEEEDG